LIKDTLIKGIRHKRVFAGFTLSAFACHAWVLVARLQYGSALKCLQLPERARYVYVPVVLIHASRGPVNNGVLDEASTLHALERSVGRPRASLVLKCYLQSILPAGAGNRSPGRAHSAWHPRSRSNRSRRRLISIFRTRTNAHTNACTHACTFVQMCPCTLYWRCRRSISLILGSTFNAAIASTHTTTCKAATTGA